MTVTTDVISNPNRLLEIEKKWNTLAGKCIQNPFCLTGFVKQFMELHRSKGWSPLVLVISTDNTIVGIAPLITKKKLGVRFVRFVGSYWFPPDLIVDDQHRETFIGHTLDFLLKTLRCQFVEFTLPAESPNLQILKQKCKATRIYFLIEPATGRCILPIRCTWDEFEALRGRNFRRRFKKIERKLNQAGSWRIKCVENRNKDSEILERILDVERMSWKQAWRNRIGVKIDPDLPRIWKAAQHTARTEPDFKWSVWFLELDGKTLAYCMVLQYKKVAIDMKTSYDRRYKKFYPGVFINNAAIRELFNRREVRNIDFLEDLPFHRIWTSLCLPRVRVVMSRKGVSSILVRASSQLKGFLTAMSPQQLKRTAEVLRAHDYQEN